jgi:tRNA G18 (ribose-2'-O)-methylase SpoU
MESTRSNDRLTDDESLPQVTLLIENPRKSNNWGPLLRCCAAFGISQIFVVGFDKCNVQGSHGASKHVEMLAFSTHEAALAALKDLNFVLYGVLQGVPGDDSAYHTEQRLAKKSVTVTIHQNNQSQTKEERVEISHESGTGDDKDSINLPKSVPVHLRPFSHRTCLVLEKKTKGLSWEMARHCQRFVHIPHLGLSNGINTTGRSWLTAEASLSILLHEFTAWAGYNKLCKNYQGQKYHVQHINKGSGENAVNKHEERLQKREAIAQELTDMENCGLGNILGDDQADGDY